MVASHPGHGPACPRCGYGLAEAGLAGRTATVSDVSDSGVDLSTQRFREVSQTTPPAGLDDWELTQQMGQVRRWMSASSRPPRRDTWDPQHVVRFDASHGGRGKARLANAGLAAGPSPGTSSPAVVSRGGPAASITLALGLAASACGGLLVGRSLLEGRGDLWGAGLPLVAAGQFGLVVGLILQLRQAWRSAGPPR